MSHYRTRTWRDKTFTPIRYFGYVPVNEAVARVKASRNLDDAAAQDWLAFNMQPVQMSHREDRRAIVLNERGRPIHIPREFWASVDSRFLFKTGGTQVIWPYGGGSDEGPAYFHEGWLNEALGIAPTEGGGGNSNEVDPSYTGVAGKPSFVPAARAEMERRARSGEICDKLADECRYLEGWLERIHGKHGRAIPKGRSLANALRSDHKRLTTRALS